MPIAHLTKKVVDAAKPATSDAFIWDSNLPGFGLKVTPAGAKVYVYQYRISAPGNAQRTPPRRYTIGRHGALTPDQARKRATELAGLVARGIDPRLQHLEGHALRQSSERAAAERARIENELTFEKVASRWLDYYEHEKNRRPSSVRQAKLVVNRHLKPQLSAIPLPLVGRPQLQAVIDAIPSKQRGMRRSVFAYTSVLFGWAMRQGYIPSNPLAQMEKPDPPKARERVLSDDELAAVWRESDQIGDPFRAFFRLLIATGQRRSEVAGMSWSEVDQPSSTWVIPSNRAKNGVAHIVPLNSLAIAELGRLAAAAEGELNDETWPRTGLVLTTNGLTPISGITKPKQRLDELIAAAHDGQPIPGWRLHDLRRTLATGLQRLAERFEVTEAVLNHVGGAKGGVAGVYQRHDWKEEKRRALENWASHLSAVFDLEGRSNVVCMRSARN